ncbi:MAG TPA: Com family DNA-binding transcriptional regulator [Syntrophomonadaceae bacterium]|nr:Com family DNA-binding transcriptional regulator [Syntrophomonadaceae bacterium]
MKDFRCQRCHRLLGRYRECLVLEIKCPRCRVVNRLVDSPPLETIALTLEKRSFPNSCVSNRK